jgi:hypothetical protein
MKLAMRLTFQQRFYLGYQLLFIGNIINIPRGRATRYVVLIRYLYLGFIPL